MHRIIQENAAERKIMLGEWKFLLDELFRMHELLEDRERSMDIKFLEEKKAALEDTILEYREEIQVNKELWPLLVHSYVE